jgi:hypothetical protein
MCETGDRAAVASAEALPASLEWKGEVLALEPVDELSVLTVCDNVTDILLPDQGPAKRVPLGAMAAWARTRPASRRSSAATATSTTPPGYPA